MANNPLALQNPQSTPKTWEYFNYPGTLKIWNSPSTVAKVMRFAIPFILLGETIFQIALLPLKFLGNSLGIHKLSIFQSENSQPNSKISETGSKTSAQQTSETVTPKPSLSSKIEKTNKKPAKVIPKTTWTRTLLTSLSVITTVGVLGALGYKACQYYDVDLSRFDVISKYFANSNSSNTTNPKPVEPVELDDNDSWF